MSKAAANLAEDAARAAFRFENPEHPPGKMWGRNAADRDDWRGLSTAVLAVLPITLEQMVSIPPDVLSWVSANPEAAKGLASGEMVAVKREQIKDLCFSAFMAAFNPNKEDGGASDWMNDTAPQVERWISQIAAPTPAPSGEAQARNPDDDYCPSDLRGPGR